MPVTINPKLTDAGKAAANNAANNGLQLAITHIALGTGKYDSQAVGAGMTAMVGRKEKIQPGAGVATGSGFRLAARFEPWTGTPSTYDASELGFFAGDPDAGGVLVAIFSHPSDIIVERNSLLYLAQYVFQITDVPAGSITVIIDPDEVAWMGMLQLHLGDTNPHPQYVRKSGDTMTGHLLSVTPPQHDSTKKVINSEFLKRSGFTLPGTGALQANNDTVLTPVAVGGWVDIRVAGVVLTLPKASDVDPGATIMIRVQSTSGLLATQGSDRISAPLVGESATWQAMQGETITVTRNAAGIWEVLTTGFRMPAGIVSYFAGNAVPPGWLKLSGQLLSRTAYPALWQFAQSQGVVSENEWLNAGLSGRFSAGTTGSNFRIPDARGTFLRTIDDGRGFDVGRVWGSFQDHANRSHNHPLYDPGHGHGVWDGGHAHGASSDQQGQHQHQSPGMDGPKLSVSPGFPNFVSQPGGEYTTNQAGGHGHNITINASGSNIGIYANGTGIQIQAEGSEARPRNLAWALAIKF